MVFLMGLFSKMLIINSLFIFKISGFFEATERLVQNIATIWACFVIFY